MSTITTNLYLTEPAYNSTSPTWDQPLNNNYTILDYAFGATTTVTVSSSGSPTYTLVTGPSSTPTANTSQCFRIKLVGAITANQGVLLPQNISGMWIVTNATSGAFTITVGSNNGSNAPAGATVSPIQGSSLIVYSDGTNVYAADNSLISGTPVVPNITVNGNITSTTATVSGALTAGSATISGALTAGSASITGNQSVGGTLTAGNITTSGTLTAATLSVSGNATIGGTMTAATSSITGNETVGGTLTAAALSVTGASTLNTLSVGGASTFTGAETHNGTATFNGSVIFNGVDTFNNTANFLGSTTAIAAVFNNMAETTTVNGGGTSGVINYDLTTQSVLYYSGASTGNFTINLRGNSSTTFNSLLTTGQSVTVAFLNTNGSTAYYNNVFEIDGVIITPKWQGGSAPTSGNANSIDIYAYTIIKTASATYTVLASQTQFA